MQVIPFLCVYILDGALFGDDVKNSCPALLYYKMYKTDGRRLLRWSLGVVPVITYHCNAVPVGCQWKMWYSVADLEGAGGSFGILETLFTFISINCLRKPQSINPFIYFSLQISNSIYQQ